MFFNFLEQFERYDAFDVARMNLRHHMMIKPYADDLSNARVLDLAAHDGRWSYALSAAGAREVIGIEAREETTVEFDQFPNQKIKDRVRLRIGDIYTELDKMIATNEQFDVVACFGIFYHVMDHYGLLARIAQLKPKLVIIDSEFINANNAIIQLVRENTGSDLNAIAQVPGQKRTLVGVPSLLATELMAEVLGFSCEWTDWNSLPGNMRSGAKDYFREGRKCRHTCTLRPLKKKA